MSSDIGAGWECTSLQFLVKCCVTKTEHARNKEAL